MSEYNEYNDVDTLEKETKYQVIQLEEDNSESSKKKAIIDNLSAELDKIFASTKKTIHNASSSEEAQATFKKTKSKVNDMFEKTKKTLKDFSEDDRVQDVIDSLNEAFTSLKTTITSNKTVQKAGEKIDDLVNSDSVQDGLKTAKNTTLDIADKAHVGLKNLLNKKDKES